MSRAARYDVIIIGAGSVGVPAAFAMAKAGVKVLVLDQFPSQGQGSQKAAIGGIRATHSDPAKISLCLRSLEIVSTWEETYGHNVEWSRGGYSFVAYREREERILKDLLGVQRRYGLNIDWLDRRELLEAVPDLNPDGLLGGTFAPDDGHCSTILLGHAFYDEAKRAGAEFRYQAPVTEIAVRGGRVAGVTTPRGEFGADIVVNAAGPWAREVGTLLGFDHPVTPDSHEGGITEPVGHFLRPMLVDTRPAPGSANYYFFQLRSGQVVFCITPSPSIWGMDRRETSEFLPMVSQRMVDLVPRLAEPARASDLARALPDDSRRLPARRQVARGRRVSPGDRDVRARLHARPRPRRASRAHGDPGRPLRQGPGDPRDPLALPPLQGPGSAEVVPAPNADAGAQRFHSPTDARLHLSTSPEWPSCTEGPSRPPCQVKKFRYT